MVKELTIYKPNSVKKEATITSPITGNIVNVLQERLGADAASKAKTAFNSMDKNGFDFLQFRVGDRRIRMKNSTEA